MKHKNYKKFFTIAAIGILLIFSGLSAAKTPIPPAEKPLPTITPTPGIQPLDDFPDKKNLG